MHIADGILSVPTCAVTGAISAGVLAYSIKKSKANLEEKQVPFLGVTAAFIFAAQMINFPVLPGTSGHLIGAVLTAIVLGPWAASIIMATVLSIQALFFGDGGIIALGANIFNLAVISAFCGYFVYSKLKNHNEKTAVALAAWLGVVAPSIAASIEIALSGILPLAQILPAVTGIHMVIGIGEAVITLMVVGYLKKVKKEAAFDV
ncbi:MAG: cobalamin biosynthesis protein [Clostridia bacterium]|nr:cobalamin biosynthesis protein [Clostridia bacterium]